MPTAHSQTASSQHVQGRTAQTEAGVKAGVLFDMDGVLVLSNQAHLAAWQEFARQRLGLEITVEMFYRSISGRKNEEALAELFPGKFTPEQLATISREKEAFYRERYGSTLQPVPGVLELIADLRRIAAQRPVALAVATSGPPENARLVLGRFGIASAFSAVVTGSQVTKAKPDPTIYLLAAQALNVQPQRCVVLEDAAAGVQAAKRASMRCLAVTTSEPAQRLLQAGADRVEPDFRRVTGRQLLMML